MNDAATPHPDAGPFRRRPRYRGTHPRRFEEKYKELHPEAYPETVQKVVAAGKTPAGTHRSVCVREILEVLNPQPGQVAVDATLGYGGHAREILPRLQPGGRLIGLDVDTLELPKTQERLQSLGCPSEALTVVQGNFAGLARLLPTLGVAGADLILADLGCSSMQLDNPERGFSHKFDGPLDLRLNPSKGHSAADWLSRITEEELERALAENSDEPRAQLLAQAIVEAREQHPLRRTSDLSVVVRATLAELNPQRGHRRPHQSPTALGSRNAADKDEEKSCLARVFQAIRIEVNGEWSALETFLRFLPLCLNPGGRVAILTFHSGEDRRVKKAFHAGLSDGSYAEIARDVIRPSAEEVQANPRAASAKLRWAIRTSENGTERREA